MWRLTRSSPCVKVIRQMQRLPLDGRPPACPTVKNRSADRIDLGHRPGNFNAALPLMPARRALVVLSQMRAMHDTLPDWLKRQDCQGILARIESPKLIDQIRTMDLPTVDLLGIHEWKAFPPSVPTIKPWPTRPPTNCSAGRSAALPFAGIRAEALGPAMPVLCRAHGRRRL